jgi:branched-chain amino acid transport system permease protein
MSYLWQILCNGLHNGALYALLAYSYVLLHQVVPKPNLAHGAFFALAGQITVLGVNFAYNGLIFTFTASLGFGLSVAVILTLIALIFFSVAVVPRLVDGSANMMIMATLAIGIVLMEAFRIGADGRDFWLPPLNSFTISLGLGAFITPIQLGNIAAILVLLCVAEVVMSKTGAGRAIRAVAQSPSMAALCGINVKRVFINTAFASGLMVMFAGLLAILYFGNMSFGAGLTYGLKILFIAAAGGFSTPRMAAVAAFAYGEAEAAWDGYMPIMWRDAFFFSALSLLLVIKGRENRLQ